MSRRSGTRTPEIQKKRVGKCFSIGISLVLFTSTKRAREETSGLQFLLKTCFIFGSAKNVSSKREKKEPIIER